MSCIYMIRHKESDNCYIGSTKDFRVRKNQHKCCVVNENQSNYTHPLYKFIRDNGGWDNFDMVKICDCDEYERLKMEQYHMDFIKPTLNCYNVIVDMEDRKEKRSIRHKKYYNKNTDKIKQYSIQYGAEKVICDCGKEVSKQVRYKARRTGRHNHKK